LSQVKVRALMSEMILKMRWVG